MSVADTLGNMAALDAWRAVGRLRLRERKAGIRLPHRQPRAAAQAAPMPPCPTARSRALTIPVSRLVFGCDNQQTMPHATAIFDDFFERGGNAFDTAYIYGGGRQERLLGRWMQQRGMRDASRRDGQGRAHAALHARTSSTGSCSESLDRLADRLRRHLHDAPRQPRGARRRIRRRPQRAPPRRTHQGASAARTGRSARLQEAEAYAAEKGPAEIQLRQQQLQPRAHGLAGLGRLHLGDRPGVQAVARRHATPLLLAWSSQARGFFTDRAHPDKKDDAGTGPLLVQRRQLPAARTRHRAGRARRACSRSTSRWPTCSPSPSPPSR